MDINLVRAVVTVLGLVLFLALVIWAWSSRRRKAFDEAAHLPFAGDAPENKDHEKAQGGTR